MDLKIQMMLIALEEAEKAFAKGEVPVGAVIFTSQGKIISRAHNETISSQDVSGHAELIAIRRANAILGLHLNGCALATTLEPCIMCFGAIVLSRVSELCYASPSQLYGAISNHMVDELRYRHLKIFKNILADKSQLMLKRFFVSVREGKLIDEL